MAETLFEMELRAKDYADKAEKSMEVYSKVLADVASSAEMRADAEKVKRDDEDRLNRLNALIEEKKAARAKAGLTEEVKNATPDTNKGKAIKGGANFVREVMQNKRTGSLNDFKDAVLAPTTAPEGNKDGASFLPINVSNEYISVPLAPNPLLGKAAHSAVTNLTLPRIALDFGTAFAGILDGAAAKEVALKGSEVTFGRIKSKVKVGVSEGILAGTDLDLINFIQTNLQDGALKQELYRAFAQSPAAGEEHMSLYADAVGIKKVSGEDTFTAIKKAIADFDDEYADNLTLFITRQDWFDIQEKLANGNASFYEKAPEQVFGIPVEFTAQAKQPVVGDFSQYQVNYDPTQVTFEQYKDYDTGINYFVVTLYVDAQVKLASAFRIATVVAGA